MRREEKEPDVRASGSMSPEDSPMAAADTNSESPMGDGKIEKIRDLLFGGHIQEINRQFTRLESRFQQEASALREELLRRFDFLERYVKDEVASLNQRLTAEQDTRSDVVGKLTREANELGAMFEKKTEQLAMQHADSQRELRESLLEQSKAVAEDVQRRYTDILTQLEEQLQNLRQAKTDRAALASLFGEMAMRLNHDGLPPELDGEHP